MDVTTSPDLPDPRWHLFSRAVARRALAATVDRELARVERVDGILSILLIAMNGLGDLRRTRGVAVAARISARIVQAVKHTLGPHETLVRDGDDLVVILPGADDEYALLAAVRIETAAVRASRPATLRFRVGSASARASEATTVCLLDTARAAAAGRPTRRPSILLSTNAPAFIESMMVAPVAPGDRS